MSTEFGTGTRLDDLKQQYVDGDLDDSEFEAQLEKRLTEVD